MLLANQKRKGTNLSFVDDSCEKGGNFTHFGDKQRKRREKIRALFSSRHRRQPKRRRGREFSLFGDKRKQRFQSCVCRSATIKRKTQILSTCQKQQKMRRFYTLGRRAKKIKRKLHTWQHQTQEKGALLPVLIVKIDRCNTLVNRNVMKYFLLS